MASSDTHMAWRQMGAGMFLLWSILIVCSNLMQRVISLRNGVPLDPLTDNSDIREELQFMMAESVRAQVFL